MIAAFPGLAYPGQTWPGVLTVDYDHEYVPPPRPLPELLAGSSQRRTRALILTGPAAGELLPVVAGSLTLVHDGPARLSGSVTVAAAARWTEQAAAAALAPRAGVEVRLSQGVVGDDGVEHWWDIGVVRPTRHAVNASASDISVECDVTDRGGVLAHLGAPRTVVIRAGSRVLAGIRNALALAAPWLPTDLDSDDDVRTDVDIVLAERAGDDLWAGCRGAARDIGRMLTVDAAGTVVAPERNPQSAPIDVPITAASVEVDVEQVVHRIEATWTQERPENPPEGWEPATGTVIAEDTDAIAALPAHVSPTTRRYSGDESVLTSEQMARQAARADLADRQDLVVSGSCTTIPHPDVVPGAVIDVAGKRYRITQVGLDLAGGPLSVSLGNTARTLAVRLRENTARGPRRDYLAKITSLAPWMTREDVTGSVAVETVPTDAVRGCGVGDVVRVTVDGAGQRTATAAIAAVTLGARYGVISTTSPTTAPATWDPVWGEQMRALLLDIKAKHA